jgi:hypothetical protein
MGRWRERHHGPDPVHRTQVGLAYEMSWWNDREFSAFASTGKKALSAVRTAQRLISPRSLS